MGKHNGHILAAEKRRSEVIQLKVSGHTEAQIATLLGVSRSQVWKDVRRRISEVRREDAEAVEAEYRVQYDRYMALLRRWWPIAMDEDDADSQRATVTVLDILRRIDLIGGLVPDRPLIQLQTNVQVNGSGATFADLLREANGGDVVEIEGVLANGSGEQGPGGDY